jgi:hypothetical protein
MDNLNFDSERFTAVWQRVTAEMQSPAHTDQPPPTETEANTLCRHMEALAQDAEHCRNLAKKCPGRMAETLQRMSRENSRLLKKLRVKYFILTGGAYSPDCGGRPICTTTEALRELYNSAVSLGEKFAEHHTYHDLAEVKRHHAETIARLIENMLD